MWDALTQGWFFLPIANVHDKHSHFSMTKSCSNSGLPILICQTYMISKLKPSVTKLIEILREQKWLSQKMKFSYYFECLESLEWFFWRWCEFPMARKVGNRYFYGKKWTLDGPPAPCYTAWVIDCMWFPLLYWIFEFKCTLRMGDILRNLETLVLEIWSTQT